MELVLNGVVEMKYIKVQQSNQVGEVLADVKRDGKERPWRWKKKASIVMSEIYKLLGWTKKADRLAGCATTLTFKRYPDGRLQFHGSMFCRVRMCPICTMRRSEKIFAQVKTVMNYMESHEIYKTYKYIFLTLTVRNMPGKELSDALDKLLYGFKKLCERKEIKAMSKGWFRALEITHNWETNMYHPHLHLIIAVEKRYFTEYENYLRHEEFKSIWRSCMDLEYDPWVHVEKVRSSGRVKVHDKVKRQNIVAELAKYTVKDEDYLILWTDENKNNHVSDMPEGEEKQALYEKMSKVVEVLDPALHKRRLAAFGGVMKKVHKLLNLDDPVDGELSNNNEEQSEKKEYDLISFGWKMGYGNYMLTSVNRNEKK